MTTRFRKQLPPNCYLEKGCYIVWRKQIKGVKSCHTLGKMSDGIERIWSRYHSLIAAKDNQPERNSLFHLADVYFDSPGFKAITRLSQKNYQSAKRVLDHEIKIGGKPAPLGEIMAHEVTKPLINEIAQKRLKALNEKGFKGTGVINVELSFLSVVLDWACNHVHGVGVANNPLKGIKKLKVESRERYITDEEYRLQSRYASPEMRCFFEIAYLCACRTVEVRNLKDSDVHKDRVFIGRRKGSKSNFVELTPRLKKAVDKARQLRPRPKIERLHADRYLFVNRSGNKLTASNINIRMQHIKKALIDAGHEGVYWTPHMLKHKGHTDADDKDLSGLSESVKRIYEHSISTHKPARD